MAGATRSSMRNAGECAIALARIEKKCTLPAVVGLGALDWPQQCPPWRRRAPDFFGEAWPVVTCTARRVLLPASCLIAIASWAWCLRLHRMCWHTRRLYPDLRWNRWCCWDRCRPLCNIRLHRAMILPMFAEAHAGVRMRTAIMPRAAMPPAVATVIVMMVVMMVVMATLVVAAVIASVIPIEIIAAPSAIAAVNDDSAIRVRGCIPIWLRIKRLRIERSHVFARFVIARRRGVRSSGVSGLCVDGALLRVAVPAWCTGIGGATRDGERSNRGCSNFGELERSETHAHTISVATRLL